MSLLRSILAVNATTLRSALACALAAGAGLTYYAAIDWEDVAMATTAEAVTMPPVVRAAPNALPVGMHRGDAFADAHAEPTADDLAPLDYRQSPPVVRAPQQAEPLYTGSLSPSAAEAPAVATTLATADVISAPTPVRSMLDHAWAPSEMLVPPKGTENSGAALSSSSDDPNPALNARAAEIAPLTSGAARTMTVSAADPIDDEAMHTAMRASVAQEPMGLSAAPTSLPAPVAPTAMPIAADPSPKPILVEPDKTVRGEDADIASAAAQKKPVARNAKAAKRKTAKSEGSAIENGFYSIQREISSFFN